MQLKPTHPKDQSLNRATFNLRPGLEMGMGMSDPTHNLLEMGHYKARLHIRFSYVLLLKCRHLVYYSILRTTIT